MPQFILWVEHLPAIQDILKQVYRLSSTFMAKVIQNIALKHPIILERLKVYKNIYFKLCH